MDLFSIMGFVFVEHFFQFFLLFISMTFFIIMFIIKSILIKYPEMFIDGLSVFKILMYPFRNKHNKETNVNKVRDNISKVQDKYDEYEEKYDNYVSNLFFPIPYVLLLSSLIGYIYYFYLFYSSGELPDSDVVANLIVLVLVYIFFKIDWGERV